VIIWYLASGNIRLFRRSSVKLNSEKEEPADEDIFTLNFDIELQSAIAGQNYRSAVRLLYLRTLKELSDHNIIDYRNGSTNRDYLIQLYNTPYYQDFFRLTRSFEY